MSAPSHILSLEALLEKRVRGHRRLVAAAGCFDVLSAGLVSKAGFDALMVGGDALAQSRFGEPMAQLLSPEAVTEALYVIREGVEAPIIADAADGFGNALHVMATVRSFEFAGASVVQFSDAPLRRSDHHVEPRFGAAEMIGKLKAALDARRHCLIGAVVAVRETDELSAVLDRAAAYIEVGADLLVLRSEAAPPVLSGEEEGGLSSLVPIGFEWSRKSDPIGGRSLSRAGYGMSLQPYLMTRLLQDSQSALAQSRALLAD